MDKRKYFLTRLLSVLFTISVSATMIPCGIINVHGLFGEVTASTITEDIEPEISNVKFQYYDNVQKVKGKNIINIWFEILIAVIGIRFGIYMIRIPRGDTIVTLKVRMDN